MDEAVQGRTHPPMGRRSRFLSYVVSVAAGVLVMNALQIAQSGWPGFKPFDLTFGLLWCVPFVSIGSLPEFLLSCFVSDLCKIRSAMIYCVGASAWGSYLGWLAINLLDDGSSGPPWDTFSSKMPAMLLPGLIGGLVQWLVSERTRPFKQ